MIICPECGGSGEGMVLDVDEVYGWAPRCDLCDGTGEIPGLALIHLPNRGSDLVTMEYVYHFLHIARNFMDGWAEGQNRMRSYASQFFPLPCLYPPRYADIRDYLYGFNADAAITHQVALHLDPVRRWYDDGLDRVSFFFPVI